MEPSHKQPNGLPLTGKLSEEDVITVEAMDGVSAERDQPTTSSFSAADFRDFEAGSMVMRERSIFDSFPTRNRYILLGLMSFAAFLVPFSDTVYLPALVFIQEDLKTTATLMSATVAVYMFAVGVTALIWGTFADRYGRRLTLLITSAGFTGFSIACFFSVNINMLIAFRALQGASVSAMFVAANAVLADSWEPAQRGKAMGIFMIPTLAGPVVGPLLGGGLSQGLGWRSTFAAMAICGALIFICLLVLMEETHHHVVLKRISASEGNLAAMSIKEKDLIKEPKLRAPWKPLRYLAEPAILPHALVMFLLYATMFSGLIVLPGVLAAPPYSLSQALIGVCNLPLGMGCFLIGPFGGRWADAGARKWNTSPAGRMVPGLIAAFSVFSASTLAFGWTLHERTNLAGPMITSFFMGASICTFFPGVMSYVSILKQHAAASAGGALWSAMFITGGVIIQVTPPAIEGIGLGPWMTILVGIVFLTASISAYLTMRNLRAGAQAQPPATGDAKVVSPGDGK